MTMETLRMNTLASRLTGMGRRVAGLVAGIVLLAAPAAAQIQVDIRSGSVNPLPIAIPAFEAGPGGPLAVGKNGAQTTLAADQFARRLAGVVRADLARSGLFKPLSPKAMLDDVASPNVRPRFANWRAVSADALVAGGIYPRGDGQVRVDFRLWDVLAEEQITGYRYVAQPAEWRQIGHKIADVIYQRLTGERGYFNTRIVYIAESGGELNVRKRLAIMDQDGYNHQYLTNGDDLVLTPRFSPDQQEITYLAYYNDQPRVYLYNLDTGRHEVLGDFPNMTFAPRFSPDGNSVVMSLARAGNSDIYTMNLQTRKVRRLTRDPNIDTSASYAPSGERMVFNSDRGGSQQLYVMNADGSDIHRISFDGGARYATPVWSPRGDLIAFTKIASGKFVIGVMRPDGSGERILTDAYQDEGPTWSPNGRVLMFFRLNPNTGASSLMSVDLTGRNLRVIETPVDASDPAWSPLLDNPNS